MSLSTKKKVLITDKISEKTKKISRQYITNKAEVIFCDNENDLEEHIETAEVLIYCDFRSYQTWYSCW